MKDKNGVEKVSMTATFNEETNRAIKHYAITHGRISKAEAVALIIEKWLIEKGYFDRVEEAKKA